MNPANVTLRQMRAFVAVADSGGFAAASRRLHLTPSALSLLIKEMEAAIGVRLFERTTRRVALSSAGAEFLPLANRLLDDLAHAVDGAREREQLRRGAIRVACTPLYAATLMPELVRTYRERHPTITIYVLDSLNEEAIDRVLAGDADLALAPQRRAPPVLVQEPLLSDRMWLLCRADHPLSARARIEWARALKEPFVSLTRDFTTQLQSDLERHDAGLTLTPAHEVSFITTALGMVQSGFGITVQPASVRPLLPPFGLVARRIVAPLVSRQLSLFYRSDREPTAAARSFRALLHSTLRATPRPTPHPTMHRAGRSS